MLWRWPHKWAIFFFRDTVELEVATICTKITKLCLVYCVKYEVSVEHKMDIRKNYEDTKLKQKLWFRNFVKWPPFLSMVQYPPVSQGLLIIEASRSHLDIPQSVGSLWTSDQPDTETSTWQHTTLTREIRSAPGGIPTHNPSKRAAADARS